MMERGLFAYDYVDLKNREYERRHTQPRHLGDVDGKYRYRPRSCTPTLISSLVNLEIPETRAINNNTAGDIIATQTRQIQGRYDRTNRIATLDAWSYPPKFDTNRPQEELPHRPHTAGIYEHGSPNRVPHQVSPRPFSTGSPGQRVHPQTPPRLQSYMIAKLKRRHSGSNTSTKNVQLKTVTTALQDQWEEEDRSEQQSPRRVKSQNAKRFDSFAGQWLSFAGGTDDNHGGVLDAFTGEAADEYYNVESCIGANIATQLNRGNKIRVGKNGVLQSNSLKVNKWKNEIESDSSSLLDGWMTKQKPINPTMVPLSWEDQLTKPDANILEITEKPLPKAKPDLCERRPVVYEKLVKEDNLPKHKVKIESGYKIQQRSKNKRNIDGTESLNNRITMITVDEVKEDRDSLCSEEYEELLQRSLQTTEFNLTEKSVEYKKLDDFQAIQDHLSPPAPSLANESLDTFDSDDMSPSSPMVQLKRISLSSDELVRPTIRQTSAPPIRQSAGGSIPSMPHLAHATPNSSIKSARTRSKAIHSAPPKRAQSSPPRRKNQYQFDEPPTPRNIHSPRPNLAKPGHFARSGVASISASSQDAGEQEYIQISHQLLPSSGGSRRLLSATTRSDISKISSGTELEAVMDGIESASINSMDVNKGDPRDLQHDDEHRNCTCSPEAKRVLSAALSRMSNNTDPVINIPTADNTDAGEVHSRAGSSAGSYYSDRSDLLNELESALNSGRETPTNLPENDHTIPSEQNTNDQNVLPEEQSVDQSKNAPSTSQVPQEDIFINQTDGLGFDQKDLEEVPEPKSRSNSALSKKKSVKFADEQGSLSPSVPQCTPSSTPREPTSDVENE